MEAQFNGDNRRWLCWEAWLGDCPSKTITALLFYVTLASASSSLSLGDMSRKLPRGNGIRVEFPLKATTLSGRWQSLSFSFLSHLKWQVTSSVPGSCGQNSPAPLRESLQIQYASELRDIHSSEWPLVPRWYVQILRNTPGLGLTH